MAKLTKAEKELRDSIEKGEWRSVKDKRRRVKALVAAARNTLRKNQRINIRISQQDLAGLQTKAVEEGIPYQTLIASILHKFVTGRLIQKN